MKSSLLLIAIRAGGYTAGEAADPIKRQRARPAFQGLICPGRSGDVVPVKDAPPAFLACGEKARQDLAGKGIANPIAQIPSAAMMLRYSLGEPAAADAIEAAVRRVIGDGLRTGDIFSEGTRRVGTREMGEAIAAAV